MQEVILDNNDTGRLVYVDSLPIRSLIPETEFEIFIKTMAIEIGKIVSSEKSEQTGENYEQSENLKVA